MDLDVLEPHKWGEQNDIKIVVKWYKYCKLIFKLFNQYCIVWDEFRCVRTVWIRQTWLYKAFRRMT